MAFYNFHILCFLVNRFISFPLIGFMPPILVGMRNLDLLLIMKLEIYGSSFYPQDVFCLLAVKYAFLLPFSNFMIYDEKSEKAPNFVKALCHIKREQLVFIWVLATVAKIWSCHYYCLIGWFFPELNFFAHNSARNWKENENFCYRRIFFLLFNNAILLLMSWRRT